MVSANCDSVVTQRSLGEPPHYQSEGEGSSWVKHPGFQVTNPNGVTMRMMK